MIKTTPIKQILILSISLVLLLAYQYSGAQWTPPSGSPPSNNTDAPLNTSTSPQSKLGNIGAIELIASDYVKAGLQMWSPEYCDETGANCFSVNDLIFVAGSCSDGNMLIFREGDGWLCKSDTEVLNSLLPNCTNGQILRKDGGFWVCAN